MDKFNTYNPSYYYDGPWGASTKEVVMDIGADRLDQAIVDIRNDSLRQANIYSSSYLTSLGLPKRMERDIMLDLMNPEQKLPIDFDYARMIDTIPMFGFSQDPLPASQDTEIHNQVNLVQSAFLNASRQERLYTDPNVFGEPSLTQTDGPPFEMMSGKLDAYTFEGNAAGIDNNQLSGGRYDEAVKAQSIETMTAF